MSKTLIIEIHEQDENLLMALFEKFKVKVSPLNIDEEMIRTAIKTQYVATGEWQMMDTEAREDAVLYERMKLTDRSKTVNTDDFLKKLRQK